MRILVAAVCAATLACSSAAPPSASGAPAKGLVGASVSDWRLTGRVDSKTRCNQTDAPKVISSRQARYPEELVQKNVHGIAVVQGTVGADGVPEQLKVVRADHKALGDLALETFGEWRYKPALCDARPVDAYVTATFSFRIER